MCATPAANTKEMNGDEVTDQSTPDGSASEPTLSEQSARTPSQQLSFEDVISDEPQATLDTTQKKQNDMTQSGSLPAVGLGDVPPSVTGNVRPSVMPSHSGPIPLPTTEAVTTGLQSGVSNTGGFRPVRSGDSGDLSRVSSSHSGAIPQLSSQDVAMFGESSTRTSPHNARAIIHFEKVSKVYPAQPNTPALNNISMTIASGEFVFLVGHSGSGKSTFIRLINHEFVTTSGRLVVAGEDLSTIKRWRIPYLRRNIGCVFQDFKLLPNKTAFQNVAFALEVIGKSKHIVRTQVPEVLRLVGLEDKTNKYPDQLSGGEQQRVSIARAIVNRPPMLICDEPTGNLDPQTSLGIMRLLDRINRTGTTILVATHDREMVDSMRKRVVALENGFMVRDEDKGVYGLDA